MWALNLAPARPAVLRGQQPPPRVGPQVHVAAAEPLVLCRVATTESASLHHLPLPTGDWTRHLPVIGETLIFSTDPLRWSRDRVAKHGPVYQSHLLGKPMVVVGDLANWQKALSNEYKLVTSNLPESFKRASGAKPHLNKDMHAADRKAIAQAFEPEAMASYLPMMEQILSKYLQRWTAQPNGIDLVAAGRKLGFEFAAALVLGMELDEDTRDTLSGHYSNIVGAFFAIPYEVPFTPFAAAMASRRAVREWIRETVLPDYQEYLHSGEIPAHRKRGIIHSFLDGVKASKGTVEEQIVDSIQTSILAGNDTTATGMISLLGLWPLLPQRVKDKLAEEQDKVRQRYGDDLNSKALNAMPYALSTVKEVMRVLPTTAGVFRDAIEDFELGGKLIRKGTSLMLMTHPAHASDPKLPADDVRDPLPAHMDFRNLEDCFEPERWLRDSTRPALAIWGMGPHTCQGMPLFYQEAKMLLALLTRSFDVRVTSGPFEWKLLPIPSPKTDVTLQIVAR